MEAIISIIAMLIPVSICAWFTYLIARVLIMLPRFMHRVADALERIADTKENG